MRAVNLLPSEVQNSRGLRGVDRLRVGAIVLTFVVAAAVGGGFVSARSHAASEKSQLATARSILAALQTQQQKAGHVATPSLTTPSVTSQQAPWKLALSTALATRVSWDHTLAELARVIPADVTLTNVTLGGAPGATGTTSAAGAFQLSGNAYTQDGVAQLLSRLTLVPDLSQVTLTSTSTDAKTGVVTFEIAAQVTGTTTAFTAPTTSPSTTTSTSTTTTTGGAA